MNTLQGKKIVLGITGSIAAYKAAVLTRGLIKKGAEVQIVITPAGKEFITPITLSALTSKPVISEFFSQRDGTWHSHVDLGLWADAMVIAPATAATIGKMAHGIADNMPASYTHPRAHETKANLVCSLLLETKNYTHSHVAFIIYLFPYYVSFLIFHSTHPSI